MSRRSFAQFSCSAVFVLLLTSSAFAQTQPSGDYTVDLVTVLRLAGAQNLDVQLARTAVDEARGNYNSAIERFLPTLIPSANYLKHSGITQNVTGNLIDVDKHSNANGLTLTAQIPIGDAIYSSLQARQLLTAADAAAAAQTQDSILTAAQQYFDLVRARALVDVVSQAQTVSASYQQQLDEAVRIGIAFKGDALRVETQTQRLQLELRRASEQQRLAGAKLAQTLHLDPLVALTPADSEPMPLAMAGLEASLEKLVQQALDNRPELERSRAQIAAAEQSRRGAVYGPLIPTLGAQAFGGELNGGVGSTNDPGGSTRDYAVGLSWRIGPGGLFDLGRIKSSNARLSAAEISNDKLRNEIARQVVEGHTHVQSLFAQLRIARLNLTSAAETLRLTRERKQLGVGTVLEDIQAQQELLKARTEYVNVVTELNQAQYSLTRGVGGSLGTSINH
ncbi:MAG TPA: TolC family protein [Steroidobacteraceae bacterium]|nr:TolC family protein [Steroidobacteraceae bacterium]